MKEENARVKTYQSETSIDLGEIASKMREGSEKASKKLKTITVICSIFMVIQFVGGLLANSIAIMSDAAHLLSDLLGFIISLVAIYLSQLPASVVMTYGYHRAEVIGAMSSIILIWGLTIWLVYEAILRILYPFEIDGFVMVITASIGLGFNIIINISIYIFNVLFNIMFF